MIKKLRIHFILWKILISFYLTFMAQMMIFLWTHFRHFMANYITSSISLFLSYTGRFQNVSQRILFCKLAKSEFFTVDG
jgi:hypothetical protein